MFRKYVLKNNPIARSYGTIAYALTALIVLLLALAVFVFAVAIVADIALGSDSALSAGLVTLDSYIIVFDLIVVPLSIVVLALSTLLYIPYYFRLRSRARAVISGFASRDASLRKAAVIDACDYGFPDVEDGLVNVMLNDAEPGVSFEAYTTLAVLGKPQSDRLLQVLTSEKDESIRLNAIRLLRRAAIAGQAKILMDLYTRESSERVKREILGSLSMFESDDLRGFFINALSGESVDDLRLLIIGSLGRYGDNTVAMALLGALPNEKNAQCRLAIVSLLGKCDDRAMIEPLIGLSLHDPDALVRREAINALGIVHDVRSVEPLRSLLQDPSAEIRDAAAESLDKLDDKYPVYTKEVVKEVVKVPCKYCGTLTDITHDHCSSCGAPLNA